MRVRRFGKSYAHPLIVLVVLRISGGKTRVGITAGKSVGNAVQRNRAKRLLREAARIMLPKIEPGVDLVLIARKPILQAHLCQVQDALDSLLIKGKVLNEGHGTTAQP